ncbi:MAG: formyl transferase, partial [Novosphingobium sp.]
LHETTFSATAGERMQFPPGAPPDCEGMHTLSACGDVTLVDVKTIDSSLGSLRIELGRVLGRYGSI